MANGYSKFRITIGGDTLLMHNGQTADPLNKYAKAMKAITSDRQLKKTDEGIAQLMRIEYEAGLYLNSKNQVILPSRILEAHISEAARKTREGKNALAGMFVDTDGLLEYEGGPLTVKQLLDSEEHRLTIPVRVQANRVIRTRPLFRNWQTTFEVSVLEEMVSPSSLQAWLENGGNFVGLGDYRPRYGRYELRAMEAVKPKNLKAAA